MMLMLAAVAAVALSCQKVQTEAVSGNGGEPVYQFNFSVRGGGFITAGTKADATVGWTTGENVFVFFQPEGGNVLDKCLTLTYDGSKFKQSGSYIPYGRLGQKGRLSAVYVPYFSGRPAYSDGKWTIDGGDVYYSCANGVDYTVSDGAVTATINMAIPDGYVQFAVDAATAGDNATLYCNMVDAWTCVTLGSDLTFSGVAVESKMMTGHKDGEKVYFWGKKNDSAPADCNWELTVGTDEFTKTVPSGSVAANKAYNLSGFASGPEYVVIGGLKWATMNIGATTVAGSAATSYGNYYSWGSTVVIYTGPTTLVPSNPFGEGIYHNTWNPSAGFCWNNAPYYVLSKGFTKYVPQDKAEDYGYEGFYDDKMTLDLADDVANKVLGGRWRTPTFEEYRDLYEACGGTGTSMVPKNISSATISEGKVTSKGIYWCNSGQTRLPAIKVAGLLFSDGKGGNLFFPAAGKGFVTYTRPYYGGELVNCWTSSINPDAPGMAYSMGSFSDFLGIAGCDNRFDGNTVRAVKDL